MSNLSPESERSRISPRQAPSPGQQTGPGLVFGVPLGDLGWFSTLLLSFASGFAAFFAATFVAIISILAYNTVGHHTVDFASSYRRVGLPLGLAVTVLALGFLGSLWIRRQLRRA